MRSDRISARQFTADGSFAGKLQRLVRDAVVPYQYGILTDSNPNAEKSHSVENIRLAARKNAGEDVPPEAYYGMIFQDSDVAKWIEAAAYTLIATGRDETLEREIDGIVDLYAASQHADGYVNSYFTVKAPERRWADLREAHELYCGGHMTEAAVAYYEATGKRKLLDVMCRFADCAYDEFMHRNTRAYPGHPEIELALMKLWRATGEKRYLELAKHFIDVRGQSPNYFVEEEKNRGWTVWPTAPELDTDYTQSTLPVREQKDAVGHAVRAVYLYTGMADVAKETGDGELLDACRTLWKSITRRRMYVTGGIGSTGIGEAFTVDNDLPNDTVYAETCASIGLMFFAKKMLENEHRGKYGDVMERAFYNTALAGMQLDGTRFFYVNPLEVVPGISGVAVTHRDVLPERPGWYACACCPPNIARCIASLGVYAYSENGTALFADLFVGGTVRTEKGVSVRCETQFPHGGAVRYTFSGTAEMTFAVRIPQWSRKTALSVNGEPVGLETVTEGGYAYLARRWNDGDTVELTLDMTPRFLYADPLVPADSGMVAVQRGALVYCAESVDNGPILPLRIDTETAPRALAADPALLGGVVPVEVSGARLLPAQTLYTDERPVRTPCTVKMIPYYAWANRGLSEMRVWLPEDRGCSK